MGTHVLQWSSKGTDPVSVANKRICLALLRIFRNLPLNISRGDYDDIAAPFGPLLREHGDLPSFREGFEVKRSPLSDSQIRTCCLKTHPYPD